MQKNLNILLTTNPLLGCDRVTKLQGICRYPKAKSMLDRRLYQIRLITHTIGNPPLDRRKPFPYPN